MPHGICNCCHQQFDLADLLDVGFDHDGEVPFPLYICLPCKSDAEFVPDDSDETERTARAFGLHGSFCDCDDCKSIQDDENIKATQ